MEIPRFWAEHREFRVLAGRRRVTLRRFGWSSSSAEVAAAHARQRVADAWTAWSAGQKPSRREAKLAYGGPDGLPIREEILSEHPTCGGIVTRNGYGARCLNVPDVLFADIDLANRRELAARLRGSVLRGLVFWGMLGWLWWSGGLLRATTPWSWIGAGFLLFNLFEIARRWRRWHRARTPEQVLGSLRAWCAVRPDWLLWVYRTPAGIRTLAAHRLFDPRSTETDEFFAAVGVDPVYHRMCRLQDCFRARVSAKPWRIGITARIGWGTWPPVRAVSADRRKTWVATYEQKASEYAACEFLEKLGAGPEHPRARAVREWHDQLSQVGRNLPVA